MFCGALKDMKFELERCEQRRELVEDISESDLFLLSWAIVGGGMRNSWCCTPRVWGNEVTRIPIGSDF